MRELKKTMGDRCGFVVRLISPELAKDGTRIGRGHCELVVSGPLDADLYRRLLEATMKVFNEQERREKEK
jgi:hypothetical protein